MQDIQNNAPITRFAQKLFIQVCKYQPIHHSNRRAGEIFHYMTFLFIKLQHWCGMKARDGFEGVTRSLGSTLMSGIFIFCLDCIVQVAILPMFLTKNTWHALKWSNFFSVIKPICNENLATFVRCIVCPLKTEYFMHSRALVIQQSPTRREKLT